MDLFVSWSGEFSKELGEQFTEWLPPVLQSVKPYFSPDEIRKGANWFNQLSTQLNDTNYGIAMITPENLESTWIMFEAGACTKKLGIGRFCPMLFDVKPVDLKGPLAEFQACSFEKKEVKRLVESLNESLETPLNATLLEKCFETYWPELEKSVGKTEAKYEHNTPKKKRPPDELLEEILVRVRGLAMAVGSSRTGEIGNDVVADLNTMYCNAIDAYNRRDLFQLGSLLEQLYMPISFIAKKANSNFDKPEVKREVVGTV